MIMYPSNPGERLPGQDSGVFLYGGQQLLLGKTPYVDFWDHKGPLIHLINAAGLALGSGSRWGVWLLELGIVALTGYLLARVAGTAWGSWASLMAAVAFGFGLFQVGPYQHFRDSNYTETYAVFMNVCALWFWIRAHNSQRASAGLVMAGALVGASFALRPNNVSLALGLTVSGTIHSSHQDRLREGVRHTGWIVLGALLVITGLAVWFTIRGGLADLWDQVFVYSLAYSAKNLSASTAWSVFRSGNAALWWLPLGAFLGALVTRSVGERNILAGHDTVRHRIETALLVAWPLEVALTVMSGRALLHYYILWLPYLALLLPATLSSAIPRWAARGFLRNAAALAAFLCLFAFLLLHQTAAGGYLALARAWRPGSAPSELTDTVSAYVSENTTSEDTVLVWGNNVWINFLSDRPSPTRYAYQYGLFLPGYASEGRTAELLRDLSENMPVFIIEPVVDTDEILPLNAERRAAVTSRVSVPPGMPAVFRYVCLHYQLDREFNQTLVYRRTAIPASDHACR